MCSVFKGDFWKLAEQWIASGDITGWETSADMEVMRDFYDAADVAICAPGGICMGAFQDWWHLFYLKYAQFRKKLLVYYGRSFGPFSEDSDQSLRFRKESLDLLHYFSFLSIRDKKTEEIAKEIGGLLYHSTTDVAFLEQPQVSIPQPVADMIDKSPYMVFVPNYLLWHPMYKGKVGKDTIVNFYCDIMDLIWKRHPELNVVMLPQTFGSGTYEGDDVFFFREIADKKQDSRIIVVPDIYSSDIQQTIISRARFMIGARYHSVVFALNQKVPFIALNYEHKIQGLLTALGKLDRMVDIMDVFDNQRSIQQAEQNIGELMDSLCPDEHALQLATEVAWDCLHQLVGHLRKIIG